METIEIKIPSELAEQIRLHQKDLPHILALGFQQFKTESASKTLTPSAKETDRTDQVLRESGLLTELSPELRALGETATASLEEVVEFMSAVGGKPLSEIVLDQRKAKDW